MAMIICPNCGEQIPDKAKKSKKRIILAVVIVIVAALVVGVGIQMYKKEIAEKEVAEAQKKSKEYDANLNMAAYSMLFGARDAETCGNLIKQVWYNAIYEESDSATNKYTRPEGFFVSDFNEAIKNLFTDEEFYDQIDTIEQNKENVGALMKELKNPPEEYKDAYEAISKLYDAYIALTNLAISPTGNLQTYSESFNDADNEMMNCFQAVSVYLDESTK